MSSSKESAASCDPTSQRYRNRTASLVYQLPLRRQVLANVCGLLRGSLGGLGGYGPAQRTKNEPRRWSVSPLSPSAHTQPHAQSSVRHSTRKIPVHHTPHTPQLPSRWGLPLADVGTHSTYILASCGLRRHRRKWILQTLKGAPDGERCSGRRNGRHHKERALAQWRYIQYFLKH